MSDLDLLKIARQIEANQAAAQVRLAREHAPIGGGTMTFDGLGSYFNKASNVGLDGPVDEAELDKLIEFYASRGEEARIVLTIFAPNELLEALGRRGFQLRRMGTVFVREVLPWEDLGERAPKLPPEVSLQKVDPSDDALLRAFATVVESGFTPEGDPRLEQYVATTMRAAKESMQDTFIARVGDEVVGGSSCSSLEGTTLLFGTAVKPEHRKLGIQTAFMWRRLAAAQARGSSLAIIAAYPGIATERNALRIGFQMAYARVELVRPLP